MSKKKPSPGKRRVVTTEIYDRPEPAEAEASDPLEVVAEHFGADVAGISLQIYRLSPDDPKPHYVKAIAFDADVHSLDWIRRHFGAGEYQLRFVRGRGPGDSKTVTVAIDPETLTPQAGAAVPLQDEFLKLMREDRNLFLTALLRERTPLAGAPAQDMSLWLKMLEGNQARELEVLRAALGKGDLSGTVLDVAQRVVGLIGEGRAEGGEGGWLSTLRTVIKELGPVLQQMARPTVPAMRVLPGGGPVVSFPAPALPATAPAFEPAPPAPPQPGPSAPPVPPAPPTGDQLLAAFLRTASGEIFPAARRKENPEETGDWLLGEVAPNYYPLITELTYDRVIALEPSYRELDRAWLEKVIAALKEGAAQSEAEPEPRA